MKDLQFPRIVSTEGLNETIRRATPDDCRSWLDGYDPATVRVIEADGVPAGWMHLHVPSNPVYSGFVFICVFPPFRRRGIGRVAFEEAKKHFEQTGCSYWSDFPVSEEAMSFAAALGFDGTGINLYLTHSPQPVPGYSAEHIRPATADDYETVDGIWTREYAAMHRRYGIPQSESETREEWYEDYLRVLDRYFVYEENGRIMGMGGLFDDSSGIGAIAVDGAYQNRGIGTRMTAFLTNECIRRGCSEPCLYCEEKNRSALAVYEKLGYSVRKRDGFAVKW